MGKVKGSGVSPSQIGSLPEKKTDKWTEIKNFFASLWNRVFSSFKPENLPPIKKASYIDEPSSTLNKINEITKGINSPGKVTEAKNNLDVRPPQYRAANPFHLKGHYNTAISIVHEDMIRGNAEVIVNAANVELRGGGGIDGAIHRAGGRSYAKAHQQLKEDNSDFKEGVALIIEKGLPNKDVIVVAGPKGSDYQKNPKDANEKLYNCYRNALQLAHDKGKKSIAFPSISTGVFEYPKKEAAKQSLQAIHDFIQANPESQLKTIRIHCYNFGDREADLKEWGVYEKAIKASKDFTLSIEMPQATPKSYAPVVPEVNAEELKQKRDAEKVSVKQALDALSASLAKDLNKDPITTPRGHHNFSNTCYMNASLQILKNVFQNMSPDLQNLLKQDLSWKQEMEVYLSSWLTMRPEKSLNELQAEKNEYEEAFKALTNVDHKISNKQKVGLIKEEIKRVEKGPEQLEISKKDKLLFNWSFLLYMQACQYGSDDQIKEALEAHHRVCFALGRHGFTSAPGENTKKENHESAAYMELWHEMLGLEINIASYRAYKSKGIDDVAYLTNTPQGVISIQRTETFLTGLAKYFSDAAEKPSYEDIPHHDGQILEKKKICDVPPKTLTFSINGTFGDTPFKYSNNSDPIHYTTTLDLTQYFDSGYLGQKKNARYSIMGLSLHSSGHYISYVCHVYKNKEGNPVGQWYECNDNIVPRPVNVAAVPFDQATTLTYARVK